MQTTNKEKKVLGFFLLFLCGLFLVLIKPFLITVLLAATIVILSDPLFRLVRDTIFFQRFPKISALFMTLLIVFMIILPLAFFGTVVGDRIYTLSQNLDFRELFKNALASDTYIHNIEPVLRRFETRFETKVNVLDFLTQFTKERVLSLYSFSPKFVLGTATYIFDFVIMIVSVFFLYLEGPRLFDFLLKLSPLRASHEMLLVKQMKEAIRATIFGTLVTALVQTCLASLGYWICGVPVIGLAVATFFLALIPFIGTAGVWLPVALWLFLQGQMGLGTFQLLYGLFVIAAVDNVLKPILIQGKTKNHPLLIFFSLLGGMSLLGPLGIFYGPVILASLMATIQIYFQEFSNEGI